VSGAELGLAACFNGVALIRRRSVAAVRRCAATRVRCLVPAGRAVPPPSGRGTGRRARSAGRLAPAEASPFVIELR